MKTVLRDSKGNIEFIHYFENKYLSINDYKIIEENTITVDMVEKAFVNFSYALMSLSNEEECVKGLKVEILNKNGFNINYKCI